MELNREQIIKALECWASGSPCHEKCSILDHEEGAHCLRLTTRNALTLIKELTEEVEQRIEDYSESQNKREKVYDELEYTLVGVMHSVDKWLDGKELEQDEVNRAITMREKTLQIVENLTEENERVRDEADRYKRYYFNHCFDELRANVEADVKADTVRKMHNEIKERCIKGGIYPAFVERVIDQIAKEMLEGATHTNNANTCICCGETIPEGVLTCPTCDKGRSDR